MRAIRGSPRLWRLIAGGVLVTTVLVGAYLVFTSQSRAAPKQPADFNHWLYQAIPMADALAVVTRHLPGSVRAYRKVTSGADQQANPAILGVKELANCWIG